MVTDKIKTLKQDAIDCFRCGVSAADPYLAVKRCLLTDQGEFGLLMANGAYNVGPWSRIHVIAFGKAACAMVEAAKDCIPAQLLAQDCLVVTNDDNVKVITGINVLAASHPLPDTRGFNAARMLTKQLANTQQDELVLVLVSGGGSALLPLPVASVSLAEKITTTDLLLASGATINEINCVRKHLSQLKGGGVAKLAHPAFVHALLLSDVLGDDVSAIASGPTVADDTRYADAIDILQTKKIWDKIPYTVKQHLINGQAGHIAETPKTGDMVFAKTSYTLIGSNAISVHALTDAARKRGYHTVLYSDYVCGEARNEAEKLVYFAKQQINSTVHQALAIVAGGETTVILKGNGRGGRNQEMALAFAINAQQQGLPAHWVFLSAGTDGRDGPTDAAGGLVDTHTIQRLIAAGVNPLEQLNNNDSYTALAASHDLLQTGATGTNVADLQILLIQPVSAITDFN